LKKKVVVFICPIFVGTWEGKILKDPEIDALNFSRMSFVKYAMRFQEVLFRGNVFPGFDS